MVIVIEGEVVEGRHLGRELGFPTANIELCESVVVESGVYSSRVWAKESEYRAVTNVGVNPTVGAVERRAESYLLDFEGDLYGERIKVELVERLRGEIEFESVEALKAQIQRDIDAVRIHGNNLNR